MSATTQLDGTVISMQAGTRDGTQRFDRSRASGSTDDSFYCTFGSATSDGQASKRGFARSCPLRNLTDSPTHHIRIDNAPSRAFYISNVHAGMS